MPRTVPRSLIHAVAATAALSLAACGGDGDDAAAPPAPAPAPALTTLSGQVSANAALKNVVVCLDLDANDACDAGEPASEPTGADGRYTLSYDPAALPSAAAARLLAPVRAGDLAAPGTAIDAADPGVPATDADYRLQRPAGSGGAINPLTTLVQAGVAAGMTEAASRANVATQLAIDAAKIDAYQDDPPWDASQVRDNARTAAVVVATMLRTGMPLEVGEQSGAVAAATLLNNLFFQDSGNYYVQTLQTQDKAAGSAGARLLDSRRGKIGGASRPIGNDPNALYRSAFLAPDGWRWCGPEVAVDLTLGNPNRAVSCGGGRVTLGWSRGVELAGQSMAGYASARAAVFNVVDPASALGGASFPAGAQERVGHNLVLAPEIQIDNFFSRAQPDSRRTLESVIAFYPTGGAATPTGANTLSLAITTGALKNLRVSFAPSGPTEGVATYYECDLNEAQTVVSNCAALAARGSYRIDAVRGARVLRFAGQPPTPAINFDVVYAQVRWSPADPSTQWVYRAHQLKADYASRLLSTTRLNGSAWTAMQARLGL